MTVKINQEWQYFTQVEAVDNGSCASEETGTVGILDNSIQLHYNPKTALTN